MAFNSIQYLLFLPVVCLVYFALPKAWRWLWLLVCSYYFYMCWNARYALLMLLSTVITYLSGLAMEGVRRRGGKHAALRLKLVVAASFVLNLSILFFFKYFNFFSEAIAFVGGLFSLPVPRWHVDVLLPVGISFYTFQALSYTVDVYRQKLPAQRHFGKYALFVSFFPQLVAGPIERSDRLLPQFDRSFTFNGPRMTRGLIQIGWGFFKKMVIADRLAILVDTVYSDATAYHGVHLVVATVFFAIQIYCDFGGYSDIAIGSARIMGYELMENFNRPYFSKSIAEFWRRWHISLSQWFRDYLYIPLGGNRKGTARKYINILIVFLASGLWHGASITFVVWGLVHGLYQVVGGLTAPLRKRLYRLLKVDTSQYGFKLGQALCTFFLVCLAWVFFRANTLQDALYIFQNLLPTNFWALTDGSLYQLGLSAREFNFALLSLLILLLVEWAGRKGDVIAKLKKQNLVFRWAVYIAVILGVVVFGTYGAGYDPAAFIYFQF